MPAANPFQATELSMTRCLHFGLILDLLILGAFSENRVYNRKEKIVLFIARNGHVFHLFHVLAKSSTARQVPWSPLEMISRTFVAGQ